MPVQASIPKTEDTNTQEVDASIEAAIVTRF